jgi:PAS domain S-box-containing protein
MAVVTTARLPEGAPQAEHTLLEHAPIACVVMDADFRMTYVNQAAELLFGYERTELLGRSPFGILIAPEYADFVHELFKMIARGDLDSSGLGENITKDGRRFLSEWSNTRLLGSDGSFQGMFSTCTDVTERTQIMQQLEHSEQRYRSLIECLPDAILVTRGATISFVNTSAIQLFGATGAKGLVGKQVEELLHPDYRDAVTAERNLLQASSPRRVQLIGANSGLIAAECVSVPIADDPTCPMSLVVLRDVGMRDALERELHQRQKLEIVGQLAGGIAHDFNNVLSTILAACALLSSRRLDDPRAREELEFIREAADSAASLTRQLLAYARRQKIEPQVFDVNELLGSANLLLRRLLGEDIELVFLAAEGLWNVRADPRQIEQVVVNLAANARAAMPRGGVLEISTRNVRADVSFESNRASGRHVEVRVKDTGDGMDAETLARVFEPFFTTKQGGAGLGLATSYAIVTQAGGHIQVESTRGMGSVFTILLPAVDVMPAEQPLGDSAPAPSHAFATMLVVDDNLALRTVTARILEQSGYAVLQAGTANEAIEVSRAFEGTIDLLLTDVVMPGMSGVDLAPKLIAERPALRVLYMSGYADGPMTRQNITIPANIFVQKPFTPRVLIGRVQRALEAQQDRSSAEAQPPSG